jgi:hypothetical protein
MQIVRIDVTPIIEAGRELTEAILAKSLSRSSAAADKLLKLLPSPMWAETAPGVAIYYGSEQEATLRLNGLRVHVMNWMMRFVDPDVSQEADDEWPVSARLELAIQRLAEMT